jgi:predicted tellurium resistance membrane protein TerC
MRPKAPTQAVFIVATILAVLALISAYGPNIPIVEDNEMLTMTIAFILLWLGVVLKNF